jgi:hypothetical protein
MSIFVFRSGGHTNVHSSIAEKKKNDPFSSLSSSLSEHISYANKRRLCVLFFSFLLYVSQPIYFTFLRKNFSIINFKQDLHFVRVLLIV